MVQCVNGISLPIDELQRKSLLIREACRLWGAICTDQKECGKLYAEAAVHHSWQKSYYQQPSCAALLPVGLRILPSVALLVKIGMFPMGLRQKQPAVCKPFPASRRHIRLRRPWQPDFRLEFRGISRHLCARKASSNDNAICHVPLWQKAGRDHPTVCIILAASVLPESCVPSGTEEEIGQACAEIAIIGPSLGESCGQAFVSSYRGTDSWLAQWCAKQRDACYEGDWSASGAKMRSGVAHGR